MPPTRGETHGGQIDVKLKDPKADSHLLCVSCVNLMHIQELSYSALPSITMSSKEEAAAC